MCSCRGGGAGRRGPSNPACEDKGEAQSSGAVLLWGGGGSWPTRRGTCGTPGGTPGGRPYGGHGRCWPPVTAPGSWGAEAVGAQPQPPRQGPFPGLPGWSLLITTPSTPAPHLPDAAHVAAEGREVLLQALGIPDVGQDLRSQWGGGRGRGGVESLQKLAAQAPNVGHACAPRST